MTIMTDHKPLLDILSVEKGISQLAVRRWALHFQATIIPQNPKRGHLIVMLIVSVHFLKTVKMTTQNWKI